MAEPKTKPTKESVTTFLKRATDGDGRRDAATLVTMMQKASGAKGVMWGRGIVGFGVHDIAYADGHTAPWPMLAFAPRKGHLTIYINRRLEGLDDLLGRLGTHKMSGGCLHIKRLTGVDPAVLRRMFALSVKAKKKTRA